jgi:drug/metabolite transporter (DMT)-like permease
MDLWIPVTIAAAAAQTTRFVLQKKLSSTKLSSAGATFARFLYSAPLATLLALAYSRYSSQSVPSIPPVFWAYALTGGAAQIIATNLVVALFAERNFAVGLTFKKTEVLLSVLVGILILGEGVTALGFGAISLGLVGVFLLSDPPGGTGAWYRRIVNRAAGLGLASGLFFAVSGVGYRGASLSLGSGDAIQRALVTLACVTAAQVAAMILWLFWRERGEIMRVVRAWRMAALVGLASLIGSACWFLAFTLQTVAYVNALGQVELIFALAASVFVFGETITRREWQGLAVLTFSILLLVLVT